jgi:hypothetical protein
MMSALMATTALVAQGASNEEVGGYIFSLHASNHLCWFTYGLWWLKSLD